MSENEGVQSFTARGVVTSDYLRALETASVRAFSEFLGGLVIAWIVASRTVPLQVVVVGDALVALGFLSIFLVFKENTFTAATIEVAPDQRVISTGPYAIVRHPMYSGALVMLLGTPLALGSWWGLLMFIPMVLTIMWRARNEERLLLRDLRGYEKYCRIVRYRFIPFVW